MTLEEIRREADADSYLSKKSATIRMLLGIIGNYEYAMKRILDDKWARQASFKHIDDLMVGTVLERALASKNKLLGEVEEPCPHNQIEDGFCLLCGAEVEVVTDMPDRER